MFQRAFGGNLALSRAVQSCKMVLKLYVIEEWRFVYRGKLGSGTAGRLPARRGAARRPA